MTASDDLLLLEDRDAVRILTLNRPEVRNAFNLELYRALSGALNDARADDSIHVVVITGTGQAFSAGQDLKEMAQLAEGTAPEGAEHGFVGLLEALQSFDKPLLAAVNGVGMGIGFTMLGHVDLAFIADDARLRVPFAELGVPPEAASSYLFPARMGWQRAAYVLFTGDWVTAADAVEYGIAFRHCPAQDLLDETLAVATRIATAPLVSLRAIKQLLTAGQATEIAATRQREEAAFAELLYGDAFRGAIGESEHAADR